MTLAGTPTPGGGSGWGGGQIGGSHTPLQRDIETTAWTEVNKQALGINKDSIQQVFSELSPRYMFGYLGGFGYKSSAGQPLLDHPLESVRTSQSSEGESTGWKTAYEQHQKSLPPDVSDAYNSQMQLAFDDRYPSIVALDHMLKIIAQFTSNAQESALVQAPESLKAQRTLLNSLFPFAVLNASAKTGQEVQNLNATYIEQLGPNDPNFDRFLSASNQLQTAMKFVNALNDSYSTTPEGRLNSTAAALAQAASQQLAALSTQLEAVSSGNNLELMKSMTSALNSTVSALLMPYAGSAQLYLGVHMATLGLDSPQPGTLLFQLLNASGISAALLPHASSAQRDFLSSFTGALLTTFAGVAGQLLHYGAYPASVSADPASLSSARYFGFELMLSSLASSGVLESLFKEGVAISGGSSQAQVEGSVALSALAYLAIMHAGARAPDELLSTPDSALQTALQNGTASAAEIATHSDANASTHVMLSQMQLALENGNAQEFMQHFSTLLEAAGSSPKQLDHEMRAIQQSTDSLVQHAQQHSAEQITTGIVNVV
jgi:hypothetical protein